MTLDEYLKMMKERQEIVGGSEAHRFMHEQSLSALKYVSELNHTYHTEEEIRAIFFKLIGKDLDESFNLFPPFFTEFGKNITVGKKVFINSGCRFQDHGGYL